MVKVFHSKKVRLQSFNFRVLRMGKVFKRKNLNRFRKSFQSRIVETGKKRRHFLYHEAFWFHSAVSAWGAQVHVLCVRSNREIQISKVQNRLKNSLR